MATRWIVHDQRGHALQREEIDGNLQLGEPRLASCFTSRQNANRAIGEYTEMHLARELPAPQGLRIAEFDTADGDDVLVGRATMRREHPENCLCGDCCRSFGDDGSESGHARVAYVWRVAGCVAAAVACIGTAAHAHEGRQAQIDRVVTSARVHASAYCSRLGERPAVVVSSTSDGEVSVNWHCE